MSGNLVKEYTQELESLLGDLDKRISSGTVGSGDNATLALNQSERDLEEADELVDQLELEINNGSGAAAAKVRDAVSGFKGRIRGLKRKVKDLERTSLLQPSNNNNNNNNGNSRDYTCLALDMDSGNGGSGQQRNELLQGTQQLDEASRRLESVRRIALETEQIGINTLQDLGRQREQMVNTRERLDRVDGWVNRSQHLLRTMHRRLLANKLLGYIIIALLVMLILGIIYLKIS